MVFRAQPVQGCQGLAFLGSSVLRVWVLGVLDFRVLGGYGFWALWSSGLGFCVF